MKKNVWIVLLVILSVGLLVGIVGVVAGLEEKQNGTVGKTYDRDSICNMSTEQTSDGGYIRVGSISIPRPNVSFPIPNLDCDLWMMKTDASGTKKWEKIFIGGSRPDYGKSVQQTSDGGYIIVGILNIDNVWLIKTDANGTEVWNRTIGENYYGCWEYNWSVKQTSDGNGGYIIEGIKSSGREWKIIETDANGTKQVKTMLNMSDSSYGESFYQTSDGGYIFIGRKNPDGRGHANLWIIKTTANGEKEWDKMFGRLGLPYSKSVQQVHDGGYVITGYTRYPKGCGSNNWTIKIGENGTMEWKKTFGKIETPPPNQIFAPMPTQKTSGFESIFAIAGIAIIYLRTQIKKH